jgi:predicted MFS family arabinose efflux permease
MLDRFLGDEFDDDVRHQITLLTLARTAANSAYRYAAPFLAVIARGLDVELATLGVAVTVAELSGLLAPLLGRVVDRLRRGLAMTIGLSGVTCGALLAAAAPGAGGFAAALVVLSMSKIVFDVAVGSWIADRVPFRRRARAIGLTETAWALGLLVGVSLMGVATAVAGWRTGYALGAAAVGAAAVAVGVRLGGSRLARGRGPARRAATVRALARDPATVVVIGTVFLLMLAQQCVGIVFGAWLEDELGVGELGLAAIVVLLGLGELGASTGAVRFTDRWGKARSVIRGAGVMAPALLLLGLVGDTSVVVAVALLVVAVVGFEFAIVSAIPLASELRHDARATGIALVVSGGTLGRAVGALAATRLYDAHGFTVPAILGSALAVAMIGWLRIGGRSFVRWDDRPAPATAR